MVVTKRSSSLLGSNTKRSPEREDVSQRIRSCSPYQLGISSRYKRNEGYESDADVLSECAAGQLLHSKPVSDHTRPSQDQEEASSAGCEERFKFVSTAALVAAPKSGGNDGTSRSPRLDLEASPLGIEITSDGPSQLEDDFNKTEPMDPYPEPSTSLKPAEIVPTEDASPVVEREGLPSSSQSFSEITQTKKARKCSHCREKYHTRSRCPLLPCSHCTEIGHLTGSCPLKAGRYYEGKTRANDVKNKRRDPYHTKRSLDAAIKGKGGEEARDGAEARRLDSASVRKSREQARARRCEVMREKDRLKQETEKRQKEAKRQYDLKRYANPVVREKARARYREAMKAKARLKKNEESGQGDPSLGLGRPTEAKRQYNAKRERVKTPIPKREPRADLGEELDRLKETDLGLAEAIIGFHRGLMKVLESNPPTRP